MRTQLRIVAGALRGRKLNCSVNPHLRPAPQRVREALFSILGDAVPNRPFFDLFAGSGAVGLEALSRGARPVAFVERDFRVAAEIERHARAFQVHDKARVVRADVYRWGERWTAPDEPVNLFLGPPYPDYEHRPEAIVALVADLQRKVAPGSVLVLQAEDIVAVPGLTNGEPWDIRKYGRNQLWIWVREGPAHDRNPESDYS